MTNCFTLPFLDFLSPSLPVLFRNYSTSARLSVHARSGHGVFITATKQFYERFFTLSDSQILCFYEVNIPYESTNHTSQLKINIYSGIMDWLLQLKILFYHSNVPLFCRTILICRKFEVSISP
mmetsp:Transcript_17076/g.38420  ORF Transcript_17076/g.38420 Transcript_17076/m.38420 type:complete len:123 (-) Transcript_17076:1466-1834(-)